MSIGFFIGIKKSYNEASQEQANAFLTAIDRALVQRGLSSYVDPTPAPNAYNGRRFGRSKLDHHSAESIRQLCSMADLARSKDQMSILLRNPYRLAFLPIAFAEPIETDYSERIWREEISVWIGSAPELMAELCMLAAALGIPTSDGHVSDEIANKINDFEALYEGDTRQFAENERTAWFLLFEGARMAVAYNTALSLAG